MLTGYRKDQTVSGERHVARIVIHDFASPLWPAKPEVLSFLYLARFWPSRNSTFSYLNWEIYFERRMQCVWLPYPHSCTEIARFNQIRPSKALHTFVTVYSRWNHLQVFILMIYLPSYFWSATKRKLHSAYVNPPPTAPKYHGLFHVWKLPTLKSLLPGSHRLLSLTQLRSLVFRVRRKRFSIETFHLPPDEDDDQATSDPTKIQAKEASKLMNPKTSMGCGTVSTKNPLDFWGEKSLDVFAINCHNCTLLIQPALFCRRSPLGRHLSSRREEFEASIASDIKVTKFGGINTTEWKRFSDKQLDGLIMQKDCYLGTGTPMLTPIIPAEKRLVNHSATPPSDVYIQARESAHTHNN